MSETDALSSVRAALVRNTFWYGVVTVFGLGSGLVMSIVLARGLGPAAMGEYSYLLWALRVLTALATGMAGFMQFGSFTIALLVSGSSLALATFVGMVLVTWMSGRISKMNATVVFIALLFWGWLWGAWGLLLAIPIMGMVKVFSEHIEDLQPLAELLGE